MTLSEYITKHDKTHLIFDFDATLVLMNITWPDFIHYLRQEMAELDQDLWEAHKNAEKASPFMKELVEKHGDKGIDLLVRHVPPFEIQYRDKYTKNEALLKEIADFRATYRLFIWSSNSRELVEDVLAQIGMSDWFEKMVTRNDVRHIKPSPEGFDLIRDPDVPLDKYLLIGDSSHDEGAAQAVGIDFYKHDFFDRGR